MLYWPYVLNYVAHRSDDAVNRLREALRDDDPNEVEVRAFSHALEHRHDLDRLANAYLTATLVSRQVSFSEDFESQDPRYLAKLKALEARVVAEYEGVLFDYLDELAHDVEGSTDAFDSGVDSLINGGDVGDFLEAVGKAFREYRG